jgi:peptidoglycan/LPS O-acetylase OafA/YrhL
LNNGQSQVYWPWLDGLRLFAALSVFSMHLGQLGGLPLPTGYLWWWLHFGFYGVDLFFAVSGAVVTLAMARAVAGANPRRTFLRHRIARIVPLFVLTCLVDLWLNRPDFWEGPHPIGTLVAHLLFVHNWFPSTHGALNGPSWTLGVEMQFYLLVALLGGWLLDVRRALWLCLCALLLAVAWRALILQWSYSAGPPGQGYFAFFGSTQLPGVLDGFLTGALVALAWLRAPRLSVERARLLGGLLLLAAVLSWWLILAMALHGVREYWQQPGTVVFLHTLIALASALAVAGCVWLPPPARPMSAALVGCGRLTYGIYLWHVPVLTWTVTQWPTWAPGARSLAIVCGVVLLSIASWRWVEAPGIRVGRR